MSVGGKEMKIKVKIKSKCPGGRPGLAVDELSKGNMRHKEKQGGWCLRSHVKAAFRGGGGENYGHCY